MDTVLKALPGNPTGLAELMAINGVKTKEDLAWGVVLATYIQRDLEEKIGAPVMDNRNFI